MKAAELQAECERMLKRDREAVRLDDLPVLWSRICRTVREANHHADLRAEAAEAVDIATRYGIGAP